MGVSTRVWLLVAVVVCATVIAVPAVVNLGAGHGGGDGSSPVTSTVSDDDGCPSWESDQVRFAECHTDRIVGQVELSDVPVVLAELSEVFAGTTACHAVAHVVGRRLLVEFDVVEVVSVDDGVCDFGLAHGAVEGFALNDPVVFGRRAGALCAQVPSGGVLRENCAHGVGHGFVLVDPALSVAEHALSCDGLDDPVDQSGCFSAVVMAYTTEWLSV